MKHVLPALDSLKVFESAARNLSFTLAADELCISKGAVSYQISKLEQSLDCALFKRSVRQVYLTDAGQKLLRTTRNLFADLQLTLEQLTPKENEHDISIGVTTYVALRWLSSRIAAFSLEYPDVSIVLHHAVNAEDFKIQDVDIAIRWCELGGNKDRSLLKQMVMPLYPVCSPSILQARGIDPNQKYEKVNQFSATPFDDIPLLCEDRRLDLWQAWYGEQESPLLNPRRIIADSNVRTQAAIDGQGWTLADALMQAEIKSGALVAPFTHQLEGYGYALLRSPGRYQNRKVKALQEWLVAELS
jgi:DNA-binding transcriptional LysR family regulator